MRALKSILGSSLIDGKTSVGGRKLPLTTVVEMFVTIGVTLVSWRLGGEAWFVDAPSIRASFGERAV